MEGTSAPSQDTVLPEPPTIPPPTIHNRTVKEGTGQVGSPSGGGCVSAKSALLKADATFLRLSSLISTSYGQESLLASVSYFSNTLHYALFSPPIRTALIHLRTRLGISKPGVSQDSKQAAPLLALSSLISETRMTLRLLGLVSLWDWGSATVKSPPTDPVLRLVAFAQVFVNVIYQLMENVAFLASKWVISQRALQRWGGIGKWYVWSTRAWLGHILLEFVRLWRERILSARTKQMQPLEKGLGHITDKKEQILEAQKLRAWRKSLVSNLAWFPLCVHWSLEDGGVVPNHMIGLLGFIAGAWKLSDIWKATTTVK